MNIKWTKHNRLGKEPRIVGTLEEQPGKIFFKDADGNVTSKVRATKEEIQLEDNDEELEDADDETDGELRYTPKHQELRYVEQPKRELRYSQEKTK
jgi:hypothetical protein